MSRWWQRERAAPDDGRWLVVDVEAGGLDAKRDMLLAVAGVAVRPGVDGRLAIVPADSFEAVLRPAAPVTDKANILLHGIGVGAQREGLAPAEALGAFERWAGSAPLVAFHAAFDRTMIDRAMQAALGRRLPNPWIDLEDVAAVLLPQRRARSLDEWMAALGVRCVLRHQAAADVFATAELLLKLWPLARRQMRDARFSSLQRLGAQRRWIT